MIVLIGFGKMGQSIAQFLMGQVPGLRIVCSSPRRVAETDRWIGKKQKRQTGPADWQACLMDQVPWQHVTLVIETVSEDLILKQTIFRQLGRLVRPDTILTSNTSALPLAEVFDRIPRSERCIGWHFFYPVVLSPVVEIQAQPDTASSVLEEMKRRAQALNLSPIVNPPEDYQAINRAISDMAAAMYQLARSNHISLEQVNDVFKLDYHIGPLDIVRTTGKKIILDSLARYRQLRDSRQLEQWQQYLESHLSSDPIHWLIDLPAGDDFDGRLLRRQLHSLRQDIRRRYGQERSEALDIILKKGES